MATHSHRQFTHIIQQIIDPWIVQAFVLNIACDQIRDATRNDPISFDEQGIDSSFHQRQGNNLDIITAQTICLGLLIAPDRSILHAFAGIRAP